jgi:hypothetical protein
VPYICALSVPYKLITAYMYFHLHWRRNGCHVESIFRDLLAGRAALAGQHFSPECAWLPYPPYPHLHEVSPDLELLVETGLLTVVISVADETGR